MRKVNFILIILVLTVMMNGYSQAVSGKVVYEIKSIEFEAKSQNVKFNEMASKVREEAYKHSFTLEFNSFASRFIFNNYLEVNSDNAKFNESIKHLASLIFTSDFNYYWDRNSNRVILEKRGGVLIQKVYEKKDWEITTESRTIGAYLCYKAIYSKNFIGRDGKNKSIPITAWFAPSLPYSYGPKDYNGLPGIIIELQERKTIYSATAINLNKEKPLKIVFPKGKTITEEEYNRKVMSN
jgi:GLPGLI family protein